MLGFLRQKEGPIGIDLGSASLKMMQLTAADGSLKLLAANQAEVPQDVRHDQRKLHDWQIKTIKNLLASKPFKGKRAATCLPNHDVVIQHLRLNKMNADNIDQAVTQMAMEKLPFDANNALLRHIVAGEVYETSEPKTEVILLAAANAAVEQHLDLIERTRIDIESINVELCAMLSSFAAVLQDNDENNATMFVDLGHTTTKVVVAHGPHVAFNRPLKIAGKDLIINDDEKHDKQTAIRALCHELHRCVQYHDIAFSTRPVSSVVLIGGLARNQKLSTHIAKQLGLPAHIGDPVMRIDEESRLGPHSDLENEDMHPDWAIAFGLALSGLWTAKSKNKSNKNWFSTNKKNDVR